MNNEWQIHITEELGTKISLAIARRILIRAGMSDKASEMFNEVTKTHGYDEALMVISKYVDIE